MMAIGRARVGDCSCALSLNPHIFLGSFIEAAEPDID